MSIAHEELYHDAKTHTDGLAQFQYWRCRILRKYEAKQIRLAMSP